MSAIVSGPSVLAQQPAWAADYGDRDHLLPAPARLDAAQFNAVDAVRVTVGAAGAAAAATTVPVVALSGPIPNGTTLYFGGAKYATLTVAAATGAVTLTVAAIPTALVSGDLATYAGTGKKTVGSGTALGRTFAERDAGTGFGPAVNTDDEIFLLFFEVSDAAANPNAVLYRPGATVRENFLPGLGAMAPALLTALRGRYTMIRGAN